jgi:FAD/FMN-containing dehydrogenase
MTLPKFLSHKKIFWPSILAVILLFIFIAIKKLYFYATAPAVMKDCNFIFPGVLDETKPTTITLENLGFALDQKGGTINDASCLNKTSVYGVVKINSATDVQNALQFARENKLKITPAGMRHSMGGQSFIKGGLVLDMRDLNQIKIDKEHKIMTVQAGATWDQIQRALDKQGLSVKAMQSINIFTVGGTLSVNAHGMDHHIGQIGSSVKSLRVMSSNGEIKTVSATENPELFQHVLGGYGLFGVILEAEIEITENETYERNISYINYTEFESYYKNNIENNDKYGLFFARLSVAPHSYLKEIALHSYVRLPGTPNEVPIIPLHISDSSWTHRLVWNISKSGGIGRAIRWTLEKYIEPMLHRCVMTRNESMSQQEVCLVSRNQEMYDSVKNLQTKLPDTDILQEYFVPQDNMIAFTDGLRQIVQKNNANLLNATIRIVPKDTTTALPYAKKDVFAFVLYFNQKLNTHDSEILQKTTGDLIDLATSLDGTFYLPYQLYYSPEQLRKAYPEIDNFFDAKRKLDPAELFVNEFYQKYSRQR